MEIFPSVRGVTQLASYAAFHQRGAQLLTDIHASTPAELRELGFPPDEATRLSNLAAYYFDSRVSRRAIDLARDNGHSLATLAMIRRIAKKSLGENSEYALVAEFCALTGSYQEIETAASQRVEELNQTIKDRRAKSYGRRSAVSSKQATADGLKTIQITGPADDIDRLTHSLRRGIRRRMQENPKTLKSQATYDELFHQFFSSNTRAGEKSYQVVVAVGIDDAYRILTGDGDDVRLAGSDGRIITGTELINSRLTEHTFFGLVHPVEGPANLYRGERFANLKQRILAKAENPICPAPGCTTAADECELHHLDAWEQGGETNMSRLSVLCPTDNGRNDDDPSSPLHGRAERIDGRIVWVHPDGTQARNEHPAAAMGLMDLI